MCDYYYVTKEEAAPYKRTIEEMIGKLCDIISDENPSIDFNYGFSGPSSVNMITFDESNNENGLEFDVDILLDNTYDPNRIFQIFINAFRSNVWPYNFKIYEDDDEIDITFNNGEFTCSLHFVVELTGKSKGKYKSIIYENGEYIWINSSAKQNNSLEKIKWLKDNRLWMQLRNNFIYKRDNCQEYINSKDLFLETVHDTAVKNGIYKKPKTDSTADNKKAVAHCFQYVTHKEAMSVRSKVDKLIEKLHKELKSYFTFETKYVGSSSRNMITYDTKGNVGYDFDVDIIPNLKGKSIKPEQIRNMFRGTLNKYTEQYDFSFAGDSTSVITIKAVDRENSKVKYSCDFAIVRSDDKGYKQFIRFDKKKKTYTWEYRGSDFDDVSEKLKWIKSKNLTNDLRDYYLRLKNKNYCEDKHSRSILAESVNNICHKNDYKKRK